MKKNKTERQKFIGLAILQCWSTVIVSFLLIWSFGVTFLAWAFVINNNSSGKLQVMIFLGGLLNTYFVSLFLYEIQKMDCREEFLNQNNLTDKYLNFKKLFNQGKK
jgi:hypothetical protein